MRELEEAKAYQAVLKNKNGAKTKKGQTLKAKKNLFWVVPTTQFPQQVQQIMRRQYSQAANNHMMKIASSVDYVKSDGIRTVQVTKSLEHLYMTSAKFSGCVLLGSGPAYSYPSCRLIVRICHFFPFHSLIHIFF